MTGSRAGTGTGPAGGHDGPRHHAHGGTALHGVPAASLAAPVSVVRRGVVGRADAVVEQHAPSSSASRARTVRTSTLLAHELCRPGAHPMPLDISLDRLAYPRPTHRLASHTVPGLAGHVTRGDTTAYAAGIGGSSGRAAPRKDIDDRGSS